MMSSSLRRSDICLTEGCAVWPGRLHLAVLRLGAAAGGRAAAHPHGARAGGPRLEAGASVALSGPTRHMRGVASAACRGACARCGACALALFPCDTHHARAGAPCTCWVAAFDKVPWVPALLVHAARGDWLSSTVAFSGRCTARSSSSATTGRCLRTRSTWRTSTTCTTTPLATRRARARQPPAHASERDSVWWLCGGGWGRFAVLPDQSARRGCLPSSSVSVSFYKFARYISCWVRASSNVHVCRRGELCQARCVAAGMAQTALCRRR